MLGGIFGLPTTMSATAPRRASSLAKRVSFRLVAVLLSLAPLTLFELTLVALDIGSPSRCEDPFVGFSAIHPLFERSDDQSEYHIAPARLSHFRPASFRAQKSPHEFRIFVLGGSTVQGRPYSTPSAFSTWLEKGLSAIDSSRDYQVVNCGGVSYASYRLLPILEEVLRYEPDLIIFCEGHNEFLESRSYDHLHQASRGTSAAATQFSRLRTWNLLRSWIHPPQSSSPTAEISQENARKTILPAEAAARLDWQGGMASYVRDAKWHAQVTEHFAHSLQQIVDRCNAAHVPQLMVCPVSNLEWAPFKSQHSDRLEDPLNLAEIEQFETLMEEAAELYGSDLSRAIEVLERAAKLNPDHAQVHFELGIAYQTQGNRQQARAHLYLAKELDVCPLRMLEPMADACRHIAQKNHVPLVDLPEKFTIISSAGYPGHEWLIDHVHPTIEGHQKVATWILEELMLRKMVEPTESWEAKVATAYRQHLQTLDHVYFERGRARLASEQGWARGKVRKPPPINSSIAVPTPVEVMP